MGAGALRDCFGRTIANYGLLNEYLGLVFPAVERALTLGFEAGVREILGLRACFAYFQLWLGEIGFLVAFLPC